MKTLKTMLLCTLLTGGVGLGATASTDVKYFQPRELIQASNDNVEMAYNQTSAKVVITAKSAYELYSRCPWLKVKSEGNTIEVEAEPNTGFLPRTARVILTTKKENVSRVINFIQAPEPGHDNHFPLPTEGNIYPMVKMDLSKATHDPFISEVYKNRAVGGNPVKIKNNTYETALGTHAKSVFKVQLNGAMRFVADFGIDDDVISGSSTKHGDVKYQILLDGKEVAAGRITVVDKEAAHVDVNTHGAKVMELIFDPNGSTWSDHVDLGNPYFELTADKPELID